MDQAQLETPSPKKLKRKKNVTSALPSLPDPNEILFAKAGITSEMRADLLRKAFTTTDEALTASQVKAFQADGQVIYSKPLADYASRLKAVEQAKSLAGLKKDVEPKVEMTINIQLPDWASAEPTHIINVENHD